MLSTDSDTPVENIYTKVNKTVLSESQNDDLFLFLCIAFITTQYSDTFTAEYAGFYFFFYTQSIMFCFS